MKKFALILLAAASLLGTTGIASAQWYGGYGGGYYGGPDPYYRERYRERYYDYDDRYYRRRHYRRGYGYGYGYNPCGPGWSLQDGICKPYRGY
jgi:hypothetical protein